MALSSIVRLTCDTCGKVAVEKSRVNLGNKRLIFLECGHMLTEGTMTSWLIEDILNGTKLWKYQVEGVQFLERANGRAILADQQGLGKTIQALALLKLHREDLLPAIVVSPSGVSLQWHHEIIEKCGVAGFLTQVISSGKVMAAPGFDIYIISYDLLKKDNTFDLVRHNIKTVIIDECQRIKDHLSGRAKAVQKICKGIEHIIPMSGTPIKNHVGEYFTVLNLVAPRVFPQYTTFIEKDCDSYNSGWGYKVGGLRNPDAFHEKTKDFILRRTKDEVLPDLPKKFRKFFHCELDRRVNKAYAEALAELEELFYSEDDDGFTKQSNMLAIMTKMRQVTAVGKVDNCVEFVDEFLDSSERPLVIFVHHHAAISLLMGKLDKMLVEEKHMEPCLYVHAGLNIHQRNAVVEQHKAGKSRIMIASQLATGEGLNLQYCSDAVMFERQWNPANEEQSEDRFHRFGQVNPVSCVYMIASETIDEYFTQLVEAKRAIVSGTLDNKEIQWDQTSLMSELANILVTTGKKAWSLK